MSAVRKLYTRNTSYDPAERHYSVQVCRGGKPLTGVQPDRIINVEERVMEWNEANHIHSWFLANVMGGKDNRDEHLVNWSTLSELLEVCEKVLEGSHLVAEKPYTQNSDYRNADDWDALRSPVKVVRNIAVAHKLLPIKEGRYYSPRTYNEAYLKEVEATRLWLIQMLSDRNGGTPGDIYYRAQ